MGIQHRLLYQKHIAEDVLSGPVQEVKPASGAADTVIFYNNLVCSLYIHHCLVRISHQTRQELTTTDCNDCRENHCCQPALRLGLIHVQSQKTCRKHHRKKHHTLDTICSKLSPLADTPEYCIPKEPHTRTVSVLT